MFDNILFMFISCEKNRYKHKFIEMMCYRHDITNYYIVVGSKSESKIDGKYIFIQSNDHYEGLPEKCLKLFTFVYATRLHEGFNHFVKVDDDISFYDVGCFENLPLKDYTGFQFLNSNVMDSRWHQNKCYDKSYNTMNFNFKKYLEAKNLRFNGNFKYFNGGGIYILSAKALKCIHDFNVNVYDYMYEDVLIGYILQLHNILPEVVSTDYKHGSKMGYGIKKEFWNGYYSSTSSRLQFLMDCDIRKHNCIEYVECSTAAPIYSKRMQRTNYEERAAGLNDRKSLITNMFLKCKAEGKVPVLSKLNLSRIHQRKENNFKGNIKTYLLEEYFETSFNVPYVFDNSDIYNEVKRYTPSQISKEYFYDFNSEFAKKHVKEILIANQTMYKPLKSVYENAKLKIKSMKESATILVSIHLRKTDRLSNKENAFLSFENIFGMLETFLHKCQCERYVVYFATDDVKLCQEVSKRRSDLNYKVFTYEDFDYMKRIDDNYALFTHEMCIVESADIQIKTFVDSENLYDMKKPGDFYYFLKRSMHENPTDSSEFPDPQIHKQSADEMTYTIKIEDRELGEEEGEEGEEEGEEEDERERKRSNHFEEAEIRAKIREIRHEVEILNVDYHHKQRLLDLTEEIEILHSKSGSSV